LKIPALSEGLEEDRPVEAELLVPPEDIEGTLVVLGSHDNTLDLLATLLRRRDPRLRLSSGHVGSLGGSWPCARAGPTWGAPTCTTRRPTPTTCPISRNIWRNAPETHQPGLAAAGLYRPARKSPSNIRTVRDLTRPGVRFINRQRGAGTRLLLDFLLKQEGIDPAAVQGYDREEYTHMAVAANVKSGTADVGLGILAAARALGLDFVPLTPERYDLVVPLPTFEDPRFQELLAVIRSPEFKTGAEALGGYDLKDCGKIVWEQ
jgi:putative molybdopterin biosynthesis protein